MPDFIELNLTTDATALEADGIDAIRAEAGDDWEPSPPERWLIRLVARMAVEVVVLAGRVPLDIFTYFGQQVLRIPALVSTPAQGTATFTLADTLGHTIPEGTELDLNGVTFFTTTDLVVAAAAATGTVSIQAVEAGSGGSGLSGTADLITPPLVFVDAVTVPSVTTGGTDGETGSEYADRLPEELPTLSPKVVLIEDAAARARRNPVVARALAIDNYIPAGPGGTPPAQTNAEGAVTVAVHDDGGADPGASVRSDVATDIASNRIANVAVAVIAPTFTRLDVRFTALADADSDPAAVEAAAEQALADYLAPTRWGATTTGDATDWQDEPVVYRNDIIGVVKNVLGIRHVSALTLARFGDAQGTADVTLDGPAALPAPNTVVDGTVT